METDRELQSESECEFKKIFWKIFVTPIPKKYPFDILGSRPVSFVNPRNEKSCIPYFCKLL